MKPLKKISLSILLGGLLIGIWNGHTVDAISKPYFLSLKTQEKPQYDYSKEMFYYPRLDISAPLSSSASTSPLQSKDWDSIRFALEKGVSLNFTASEFPAAKLAFVTGHSSDRYPHPYSAVFAGLGQSKEGDEFSLTTGGSMWTYRVISKQIVDPRNMLAFSEQALAGNSVKPRVALVTCWPLLTSLNRLMVVGERIGE